MSSGNSHPFIRNGKEIHQLKIGNTKRETKWIDKGNPKKRNEKKQNEFKIGKTETSPKNRNDSLLAKAADHLGTHPAELAV